MSHNSPAAVIVTHNSEQTIQSCINSLHANGVTRIVVVDNTSTDATVSRVKNLSVDLIENKENTGFACAVNQAFYTLQPTASLRSLERRGTPYNLLLLLNPDAALQPKSLSQAVEHMESNPKVGIAGLLLCDEAGNPEPYSFGDEITLWSLFRRKVASGQTLNVNRQMSKVAWVSGGAMLVRREVFEQLHGFDEQFFMYWEDVDLCMRARQRGWQAVLLPQARALHQRGASLPDSRRKAELYDTSADRYFRKHYATSIWLAHRLLRRIYRFFFPRAL